MTPAVLAKLPFDLVEVNSIDEYRAELRRSDVIIDGRGSWLWLANGLTADIQKLIIIADQQQYYADVRQPDMASLYRQQGDAIRDRLSDYFSTRRQILSFRTPSKVDLHAIKPGVFRVSGGSSFHHINDALRKLGLAFPPITKKELNQFPWWFAGTRIGEAIGRNAPTIFDGVLGSWGDRIQSFSLLLADGSIVRADRDSDWHYNGLNLLECVAGTNGAMGFIMDVDLCVIPVEKVPQFIIQTCEDPYKPCLANTLDSSATYWCQKVGPEQLEHALCKAAPYVHSYHAESGLMVGVCPSGHELPRYPGDIMIFSHWGDKNYEFKEDGLKAMIRKAKSMLDPEGRMNPRTVSIL